MLSLLAICYCDTMNSFLEVRDAPPILLSIGGKFVLMFWLVLELLLVGLVGLLAWVTKCGFGLIGCFILINMHLLIRSIR